jgi:hypothetical protein
MVTIIAQFLLEISSIFLHCELRVVESKVNGEIEKRVRLATAVGSRYQKTDHETADREDSMHAAMQPRLREIPLTPS